MIVHHDCEHFLGHKPCKFRRICEGCPHYAPVGTRILIIKLGAMGDVLRTTPLLAGLRTAYPDCHITWLTEPNILPMMSGIGEINRLLPYNADNLLLLEHERFDHLYCFDKEPRATGLAMKIRAARKFGFGLSQYGNVAPLNKESEYTFELGINDELKFRQNTLTYPELIYQCAALEMENRQEYILPDFEHEIEAGRRKLEALGAHKEDLKIGLNTGAGPVFATKKWTESGYIELADLLVEKLRAKVLLLGGPEEAERNRRIAAAARHPLIQTGTDNPIRVFAGIVGNLDLMVTGDSLALHIAIGLKVPVVVILGSTCAQEIELYGRGEKIVSDFECSPCYLSRCPKERTCMDATPASLVFNATARVLKSRVGHG